MQGRRVADGERWYGDHRQPGDFGRVKVDGAWEWRAVTPNGFQGNLADHDVIEHEDGTITVEPSILVTTPGFPDQSWHGYLRAGIWSEA